jgi:hypothetical protein
VVVAPLAGASIEQCDALRFHTLVAVPPVVVDAVMVSVGIEDASASGTNPFQLPDFPVMKTSGAFSSRIGQAVLDLTDVDLSSYFPFMAIKHVGYRHAAAAGLIVAFLHAGCAAPAPETPPPADAPYRPVASIREVMNSVIDPSIDVVWNSVATVIDDGRHTDRAPVTDEDWAEVRRHALIVSEAANLLLMQGRAVAPPGAQSSAPGVELPPEEIRALIDKNPEGWNFYVQAFQDSMKPALAAIDAKNAQALFDAGDEIDTTCENCHQVFWFPNAVASAR